MPFRRRHTRASNHGTTGGPTAPESIREAEEGSAGGGSGYESPDLVDLGQVRELTLGSSSSGKADANSQYYW